MRTHWGSSRRRPGTEDTGEAAARPFSVGARTHLLLRVRGSAGESVQAGGSPDQCAASGAGAGWGLGSFELGYRRGGTAGPKPRELWGAVTRRARTFDIAVYISDNFAQAMAPLAWFLPAALAHNGYVLRFSDRNSLASTKVSLVDPTNSEINRLASSWTLGLWAQFEDLTPSRVQPSFQILHHSDGNWLQPFAGLHDGFQFAGSSPTVLSNNPGSGTGGVSSWHHYTESWSSATGERKIYVDGVLVVRDATRVSMSLPHSPRVAAACGQSAAGHKPLSSCPL